MLTLTVTVAVLLLATAVSADSHDFTHSASLKDDDYFIHWKFDDTSITFNVTARTTGYVALGFSPSGGMKGADIIIGWVKDGKVTIEDRHATGKQQPVLDTKQDVETLGGSEDGTFTTLLFKRKRQTCDDQDFEITESTMRLIWAYRDGDPDTASGPQYHSSNRGVKSVYLLEPFRQEQQQPLPADAYSVDLLNDKVHIPNDTDTTYWCTGFLLPNFNGTHHMIKMDPIVQAGHEAVVHHIIIYGCPAGFNRSDLHMTGAVCRSDNMPEDFNNCEHLLYAWAIGGESQSFPDHVGLPFGGQDDPRFVMVETHYDNPGLRSDYVDSSGMRMWLIPRRRQYDAGVLMSGMQTNPLWFLVPPHYDDYYTWGQCSAQTMAKALAQQPDGINVFAVNLHTHLAGTGVWLRHIRNGVELPYIAYDDNYDFNFQELRFLKNEVKILPSDDLVSYCRYKTSSRSTVTKAGLGTKEEMCLTFAFYYPRVPGWSVCLGYPKQEDLVKISTGLNYTTLYDGFILNITSPAKYAGIGRLHSVFSDVDWTNATVRQKYQEIARNAVHAEYYGRDQYTVGAYVDVKTPYTLPNTCQSAPRTTVVTYSGQGSAKLAVTVQALVVFILAVAAGLA